MNPYHGINDLVDLVPYNWINPPLVCVGRMIGDVVAFVGVGVIVANCNVEVILRSGTGMGLGFVGVSVYCAKLALIPITLSHILVILYPSLAIYLVKNENITSQT